MRATPLAHKTFRAERHLLQRIAMPELFTTPEQTDGVSNANILDAIQALGETFERLRETAAQQPPIPEVPEITEIPETPETSEATETHKNPGAAENVEAGESEYARDVRVEIAQMVRSIGKAKKELAAIKHPMSEDDHILSASGELDEIVLATEKATNDILDASEHVDECLKRLDAAHTGDAATHEMTGEIAHHMINIMEACNFQDITGQRVTKVVNTMRFIEDRILAMIGIWGMEAFADLPVETETKEGDEALLSGPQAANEGIGQDDIDALFD